MKKKRVLLLTSIYISCLSTVLYASVDNYLEELKKSTRSAIKQDIKNLHTQLSRLSHNQLLSLQRNMEYCADACSTLWMMVNCIGDEKSFKYCLKASNRDNLDKIHQALQKITAKETI